MVDYKTSGPDLRVAIAKEEERQEHNLELITSENFVSGAMMVVQGNILANKYAEGYLRHRYYGGYEFVDIIENLAIDHARELFETKFAGVQSRSGSQANTAVHLASIEPGNTILGMDLSAGGHLTHGSPVSFSGKTYHFVAYGVDPTTGAIDYSVVRILTRKHQPKLIVIDVSTYGRTIDFAKFREIVDEIGARLMVDVAYIAGLVAAGLHPNPVSYADITTITTHKTLCGPQGGMILTNDEALVKKIDNTVSPDIQSGPLERMIAGRAITFRETLGPAFKEYNEQIITNAKTMVRVFDQAIRTRVISGATDSHLMLIDVRELGINGKEAESILDSVNIAVNKNPIPFETLGPFKTSGTRIDTPTITTRGFKEGDAIKVAELVIKVSQARDDNAQLDEIKTGVRELTEKFPLHKK